MNIEINYKKNWYYKNNIFNEIFLRIKYIVILQLSIFLIISHKKVFFNYNEKEHSFIIYKSLKMQLSSSFK